MYIYVYIQIFKFTTFSYDIICYMQMVLNMCIYHSHQKELGCNYRMFSYFWKYCNFKELQKICILYVNSLPCSMQWQCVPRKTKRADGRFIEENVRLVWSLVPICKVGTTTNDALVTTGILQIRWTDDGNRDVAALATMYIAEVPNESSVSQRSFHRMS